MPGGTTFSPVLQAHFGMDPRRPHGAPSVKPLLGLLPSLTPSSLTCAPWGAPLKHTACTHALDSGLRLEEPRVRALGLSSSLLLSIRLVRLLLWGSRDSRGLSSPKETDTVSSRLFALLYLLSGKYFLCLSSLTCLVVPCVFPL